MRKLASVQKIGKIIPIPNKDRIVQAMVNGWSVIVGKEQFREGDLCVFFEIDSMLPECNTLANILKRGKRLKTLRMSGVLSQGLAMNIDEAKCISAELGTKFPANIEIDMDLTDVLKITKWEEGTEDGLKDNKKDKSFGIVNFIKKLFGVKEQTDAFPSQYGVSKTDEERVENLLAQAEEWSNLGIEFDRTMKMDGQSTTWIIEKTGLFSLTNFKYVMASRNRTIIESSDDYERFNNVAKTTGIFAFLQGLYLLLSANDFGGNNELAKVLIDSDIKSIAVQAELCGPKIQKNRIGLKSDTLYIFNLIIKTNKGVYKFNPHKVISVDLPNIKLVPDLGKTKIGKNIQWFYDDVSQFKYTTNGFAEGVVYRNYERGISFKCVNPDYLIKNNA